MRPALLHGDAAEVVAAAAVTVARELPGAIVVAFTQTVVTEGLAIGAGEALARRPDEIARGVRRRKAAHLADVVAFAVAIDGVDRAAEAVTRRAE